MTDRSESVSSRSGSPVRTVHSQMSYSDHRRTSWTQSHDNLTGSVSPTRDELRRTVFRGHKNKYDRTQTVLVVGPPG